MSHSCIFDIGSSLGFVHVGTWGVESNPHTKRPYEQPMPTKYSMILPTNSFSKNSFREKLRRRKDAVLGSWRRQAARRQLEKHVLIDFLQGGTESSSSCAPVAVQPSKLEREQTCSTEASDQESPEVRCTQHPGNPKCPSFSFSLF